MTIRWLMNLTPWLRMCCEGGEPRACVLPQPNQRLRKNPMWNGKKLEAELEQELIRKFNL